MRMTTSVVDQELAELSANGLVYIDSVKGGVKVRKTLISPNLEFVTIQNDADTEIVVWGAVTYLNASDDANTGLTSLDLSKNTAMTDLSCNGCTGLTSLDLSKNTAMTDLNCYDCTGLTSLDLSKNTALTYLNCNGCTGLTSLDLSKNTALNELDCNGCTGLMLLDVQNTALLESGTLADNTMSALTTLQVAGTSAWAYEQLQVWMTSDAPTGGMVYVDDNTPQQFITEAEAKSWNVIYKS
jgi:hypothetical protein